LIRNLLTLARERHPFPVLKTFNTAQSRLSRSRRHLVVLTLQDPGHDQNPGQAVKSKGVSRKARKVRQEKQAAYIFK
jgi:hypothetical protein